MTATMLNGRTRAAAALGVGALLATIGCGAQERASVATQAAPAPETNTPVVVRCEPHQRALVRPVVVNGETVSQVECVAAEPAAAQASPAAVRAPVVRYTAARAPEPVQPVYEDLGDATVVPVAAPAPAPAPVRTAQVVYDEPRPAERPQKRSVKKSAIIIGSSAGIGAGVGAAMGGKKGALIGAAIGGGGAAIWDQITRRK